VNKGAIRSRDVKIMGVSWDGVRIAYCTVCGAATKDISVLCAPKWSDRHKGCTGRKAKGT
jgi:hypothetical protein